MNKKFKRKNPRAYGILRKLAILLAVIISIFMAMSLLGIDLTALATLGGLVMAGVSFGAKQVIADFLATIVLMADSPFTIGQRIHLKASSDVTGVVKEIGWRDSIIETSDGCIVSIPNSSLTSSVVTVLD